MGNVLYDFADYGLSTDDVVEKVLKEITAKYDRNFKVVKIGERYGTEVTNQATIICTIENWNKFLFKVKYDMVEEKIIEDNFLLRCTCFYVEKEINKILGNTKSLVRVEIEKKNKLNNVYNIEEFFEKFPKERFIATIVVDKNDKCDFNKILEQICTNHKKLNISILAYELENEEFEEFYNKSKSLDEISMNYTEGFKTFNRKIFIN